MKYEHKNKGIVLLEDGTVFEGRAAGAQGTATGEICFNTGMTVIGRIGKYFLITGQIMTATTPHIGNYGITDEDMESETIKISGLICKKFSDGYSRPRATMSLDDYLKRDKVLAITDIDTRALVTHIRDKGAMNAIISSVEFDLEVLKMELSKVPSMDGLELASKVSTHIAYEDGSEESSYRVALIDLGTKKNIVRCLVDRNCFVKVFPYDTSVEDIMEFVPDGILVSNGPGDPSPLTGVIGTLKELIKKNIPIFGICLGHQVLSLANGLSTSKMHNGHRGINHPVKNLKTGHCEVTSQNHGFVVDRKQAEMNEELDVTHIHLNDETLAGIRMKNRPVFSVQYHPEASPGPLDSRYLFDDFIGLMEGYKKNKNEFHKQYHSEANS
ncbi:MAG: glutamine-hydrolyzing carbamoyl-phosphate synthase small subunit [Vicingaceae bacterium]